MYERLTGEPGPVRPVEAPPAAYETLAAEPAAAAPKSARVGMREAYAKARPEVVAAKEPRLLTSPDDWTPDLSSWNPEIAAEVSKMVPAEHQGVFHVTTNYGAVRQNSLKSGDDVPGSVGLGSAGAGRGRVSVTYDRRKAEYIRDGLRFASNIARGDTRAGDILPFFEKAHGLRLSADGNQKTRFGDGVFSLVGSALSGKTSSTVDSMLPNLSPRAREWVEGGFQRIDPETASALYDEVRTVASEVYDTPQKQADLFKLMDSSFWGGNPLPAGQRPKLLLFGGARSWGRIDPDEVQILDLDVRRGALPEGGQDVSHQTGFRGEREFKASDFVIPGEQEMRFNPEDIRVRWDDMPAPAPAPGRPALRAAYEAGKPEPVAPEPVAPEPLASATPAPLRPVKPVEQTRWFHGTKADISDIGDFDPYYHGNPENLFGYGLYLTDEPAIATGYAKTRGPKASPGQIMEVQVDALNTLDLDRPLPPDVVGHFGTTLYGETYTPDPNATGREVVQGLRDFMGDHEFPTSEASEVLGDLAEVLKDKGYAGMRHIGGRTGRGVSKGKPEHNVLILFDPNDRYVPSLHGQPVRQPRVEARSVRSEPVAPEPPPPTQTPAQGFLGSYENLTLPHADPRFRTWWVDRDGKLVSSMGGDPKNLSDDTLWGANTVMWKGESSDQGDIHLEFITVNKDFRGHGVGRQILKEIIRMADRENLSVSLEPDARGGQLSSADLDAWYRRYGFETMDHPEYGELEDVLIRSPSPPPPTQTPAFRRWFGESKVVDEKGEPMVVYKGMWPYDYTKEIKTPTPGTPRPDWPVEDPGPLLDVINRPSEFPSFLSGEPGVEIAGFFGDAPTASRFAEGMQGTVYPVHLSFQKPYVIDAAGKHAGDVQFQKGGQDFRDSIRSGEYDSVIIKNTKDEGTIYVALKPTQIKSATGNVGTYDPKDPRIAYGIAGAAAAADED